MTMLAPTRKRAVAVVDDNGQPISYIDLRRAALDDNAEVSEASRANATAAARALGYPTLAAARQGLCLPVNG